MSYEPATNQLTGEGALSCLVGFIHLIKDQWTMLWTMYVSTFFPITSSNLRFEIEIIQNRKNTRLKPNKYTLSQDDCFSN